MFMLTLHEIESGWASKDTLGLFGKKSETYECVWINKSTYLSVYGKLLNAQ